MDTIEDALRGLKRKVKLDKMGVVLGMSKEVSGDAIRRAVPRALVFQGDDISKVDVRRVAWHNPERPIVFVVDDLPEWKVPRKLDLVVCSASAARRFVLDTKVCVCGDGDADDTAAAENAPVDVPPRAERHEDVGGSRDYVQKVGQGARDARASFVHIDKDEFVRVKQDVTVREVFEKERAKA